jgi:tetratricopeptide (TPR) repeat protein
MSRLASLLLASCLLAAPAPEFERARELYQRTEYQASLNLLLSSAGVLANTLANGGAGAFQLMGQDYFMLGDPKKATDEFDKALTLLQASRKPADQQLYVWLGRAYGRRAETSSLLNAPGLASRARNYFETAVQMDILNKEATGDLFDYYMGAPGIMGGGLGKAQDLARKVSAADPAEGQHLLALLSERSKQYDDAEQHLRRAIQLAPTDAPRVMELARFLAKRGRAKESDTLFEQAQRIAPENHAILFFRAATYIEGNRNLSDARALLEKYIGAPLTPEDPPRRRAQELLAKTPR